jgi:hypothetical protein
MAARHRQVSIDVEEKVLRKMPNGLDVSLKVARSALTPEDDPARMVGLFIGVQCVFHAEYVHGVLVHPLLDALTAMGNSAELEAVGGAVFEGDEDEDDVDDEADTEPPFGEDGPR